MKPAISYLRQSNFFGLIFILLTSMVSPLHSFSQPGDGPYGPVRQSYGLPQISGNIIFVSPDGRKDTDGSNIDSPTTLEAAISRVSTGDAIILRGGTYRTGGLVLNQGITMQPYMDELPIMKGTFVADNWKNLGNGLWTTHWEKLFPAAPADWWQRDREGKRTPLHKFNNDMVFVDGRYLQSAGYEAEVDENSFYVDYTTGTVYIGVDPTDRMIEITAFDVAIHRTLEDVHGKSSDGKGPEIRGITFTQYAYRAFEFDGYNPEEVSPEAAHGKDVVGTTLEHCTISYCSRVAGYFRGDHLTIRNCKVSDTSTEGIFVLSSSDVLLEKNIFTRNNIERITGYYPSAVKIFNQCYRVTCANNLVKDLPFSNGIWYDVGNVDGVFINNWIENVGIVDRRITGNQTWPSESGFFFEISKGAICAGNVFVNCEMGVHILNSCDVKMFQNTFVNSTATFARSERSAQGDHFGWHPASGPDVDERDGHVFVNNLMYGDQGFHRPLLFVWQRDFLCERLDEPQFDEIDHNVYAMESRGKSPLILWSPVNTQGCIAEMNSPEDLNQLLPQFSGNSKLYLGYNVFQSQELKRLALLESFTGHGHATKMPDSISKVLNRPKKDSPYVGAYPIVK